MQPHEIDEALRATLADHRLSRSEKRALREVFSDLPLDEDLRARLRARAFAVAQEELERHEDRLVVDWLEEVVKVIRAAGPRGPAAARAEAHFAPHDDCAGVIVRLFRDARRAADVCVFTITDDRIAAAMREAHARGVALRVITDDDKVLDRGSDVPELARAGIPVRTDHSEAHMHNKFAVFDHAIVLTGSYNWTRGAARENEENIVVSGDPRLVGRFAGRFEDLWEQFG